MALHPGLYLLRWLRQNGITQQACANDSGVSMKTINALCNGHQGLTVAMARRLEAAVGVSARKLLRMDLDYRLATEPAPLFIPRPRRDLITGRVKARG